MTASTNTDHWVLLDLHGLIMPLYHSNAKFNPSLSDTQRLSETLTHFSERYLLPILNDTPLNRIIAVHQAGNDYRKALMPSYRAQHKAAEQKTQAAQHAVKELLHALGIVQVSVIGTEADDVIAYLEQTLPGDKTVYTANSDLIVLSKPATKVSVNGETISGVQKNGVEIPARHITLYKSLVGDLADNYPGVPGFDAKAWVALVAEYDEDGIAELIDIAERQNFIELKNIVESEPGQHRLLQTIVDHIHHWRIGYQIAQLHPELVGLKVNQKFRRLNYDKRLPSKIALEQLAERTGSPRLVQNFQNYLPHQTLITQADWDESAQAEVVALFAKSRFISLDLETWAPTNRNFELATTGGYVDMLSSRITGVGMTCGVNLEHTFYFAFEHADTANNISKQQLLTLLDSIPESTPIIIQNYYFEHAVLMSEFGCRFPLVYDTKIMAAHIDETHSTRLKDLSKTWLNYRQVKYTELINHGETMKDKTSLEVFQYGADDPLVTAHLFDLFYLISQLEGSWPFIRDHEFPAVELLVDAYLAGVSVDWAELARQHQEDQTAFNQAMSQVRALLKQHQTPELLEVGLANWVKELHLNYDAESNYLKTELNELKHTKNLYQHLQSDKKLWAVVKDRVSADDDFDSVLSAYTESRAVGRLCLNNKALEQITYQDAIQTSEKKPFDWNKPCFNNYAKSLGLPEISAPLADLTEYRPALQPLNAAQTDFVTWVNSVLSDPRPKKTAIPEFQALARQYHEHHAPTKLSQTGSELNLNSPSQMQALLYGMLALPLRIRSFHVSKSREQKGLGGAPLANEDAIRTAIAEGDAPEGSWQRQVLDCLMIAKKADTRIKLFYNKLPLWKHPKDGLIHPQFNSVGTETRRPTGANPNLLQLSKKGEGVKVRRCFIPNRKLGHDLIFTCDWAAQELRVLAALSGDSTLTACYVGENLLDVHSVTAAGIMGIRYDEFQKGRKSDNAKKFNDARSYAKSTNFGSAYGIGPAKLARQILCRTEDAKSFLAAKKRAMPGVEIWKEQVKAQLHAQGYVRTGFGSRKHVFDLLNHKEKSIVAYYERSTINYLIQAVCADYLKKVLADLWRAQTLQRHGAVLLAPIYDELVISCHSRSAISLVQEVYRIMTLGIPCIPIPMLAAPALGPNFADQTDILADENDPLTDHKIAAAIAAVLEQ